MTFHYQWTSIQAPSLPSYMVIFKNLEKTVSGERTSRKVNGIAIQVNFIGPSPRRLIPDISKYERSSTGPTPQNRLVCNVGHRVGPSKIQLEPTMQLHIILHSEESSRCRMKGYLCGAKGHCHRISLLCNGGQKYNRAPRQVKNVCQT